MKKIFYLMAICLLAIACKQTPNQLVLTGTGLTTTSDIYVFDIAENKPIDTIKVEDSNFTYTLNITGEPKILAITDKTSMMHYLIAEKGNLTLAGDTGIIKGSPMNDRFADLFESFRNSGKETQDKIQASFAEAEAAGRELTESEVAELQNLQKNESAKIAETIKKYYEKDKGTILGVAELMLIQNDLPFDEFKSMYEQGGEAAKSFPPFVKMLEAKANMERTEVGAKFIDFEGVNPKNTTQTIKLSDFAGKGKYVLLDFWASWCGPCRQAMPEIKALNDKYSAKGLEVIGVVVSDELDNHLQSAKSLDVTWTQIFDNKDALVTLYGLEGIPTLILLDKDGTILVRTHEKQEVKEKIESLLGK
jgi:thiol-disulfide isomerase/thioredoxin